MQSRQAEVLTARGAFEPGKATVQSLDPFPLLVTVKCDQDLRDRPDVPESLSAIVTGPRVPQPGTYPLHLVGMHDGHNRALP